MTHTRAHLVQFDISWENKQANYAKVRTLLESSGIAPGDLVVLPELFDTGFSLNLNITADSDGRTLAFLRELSAGLRITLQGARTVIGSDGRGRNRATITGPDGAVLAEYDKVHPFTFGREAEFFTGGDEVITFPWTPAPAGPVADSTIICPAICYDLRFPELFRIGLARGAEIFTIGANWPAARAEHRRALCIARAIENQACVLAVNRIGSDPNLAYAGGTLVVGPKGEVVAEMGEEQGVLSVDLDLAALRQWRATFPAWRDRRLTSIS
ncbi:MAG: hypothetical protein KF745_04745 [Phycisphaeraceae bacterium]|nr:hypothetical protein [Phycisphaeraceae bacterium]